MPWHSQSWPTLNPGSHRCLLTHPALMLETLKYIHFSIPTDSTHCTNIPINVSYSHHSPYLSTSSIRPESFFLKTQIMFGVFPDTLQQFFLKLHPEAVVWYKTLTESASAQLPKTGLPASFSIFSLFPQKIQLRFHPLIHSSNASRAWNLILDTHVGGRNTTSWRVVFCLLGYALAGNCNGKMDPELEVTHFNKGNRHPERKHSC